MLLFSWNIELKLQNISCVQLVFSIVYNSVLQYNFLLFGSFDTNGTYNGIY